MPAQVAPTVARPRASSVVLTNAATINQSRANQATMRRLSAGNGAWKMDTDALQSMKAPNSSIVLSPATSIRARV